MRLKKKSGEGPDLANIVMTELKQVVVPKLFFDNIIKFYTRYVDDALVLDVFGFS